VRPRRARYFDRLLQAYPIHPEVFDRLYEDWTTIDGFQRTRGVLKLMAKVIYRLWKDNNTDLMILPGSLPLYDGGARNELNYYLPAGLGRRGRARHRRRPGGNHRTGHKEPRFGAVTQPAAWRARSTWAARRRRLPPSRASGASTGRASCWAVSSRVRPRSPIADALSRLADRLHYLNSSGDKAQEATRFWFDTRANLRREMEERKKRFDDQAEVRSKMAETLKKLVGGVAFFDGHHIFTPHADVPDDSALRLVVLAPEHFYARDETRPAFDAVLEVVRNNGPKPRYRANRLIFLAPDHGALVRLRDSIRTALAWASIVDDVKEGRLNIDQLQRRQAEKELQVAEEVLPRAGRECYKWLLCPAQHTATDTKVVVEALPAEHQRRRCAGQ
jgi:predicted AAA+ superfamily ATPase